MNGLVSRCNEYQCDRFLKNFVRKPGNGEKGKKRDAGAIK